MSEKFSSGTINTKKKPKQKQNQIIVNYFILIIFKRLSTIEPGKIANLCLKVLLIFFLSFVDILKNHTYDIIFMWQNSIYHPIYYKITKSIFSTFTFNFMNEQMHIADCHFKIHNNIISRQIQIQTLTTNSSVIVEHIFLIINSEIFNLTDTFLKKVSCLQIKIEFDRF